MFHTDSEKFSHALSVLNVLLADRCALSLALPLHIGHYALVRSPLASGTFRLSPEEDFLVGVSYRDGVLRLRSSGGRRVAAGVLGLACLFAGFMFASPWLFGTNVQFVSPGSDGVGASTHHPARMAILGAISTVVAVYFVVKPWCEAIVADEKGLLIRRGVRHIIRLAWTDVADLRAVDSGNALRPFGVGAGLVSFRFGAATNYSCPSITTSMGRQIRVPELQTAATAQGWSTGSTASGAEMKMAVLRRFREQIVGPWPAPSDAKMVAHAVDAERRATVVRVVAAVVAAGALAVLVPWAM